jgi:hypothetical protein
VRIYIPTYRRVNAQHTYYALPPGWQARTTFVVDAQDALAMIDYGYASGLLCIVPDSAGVTSIAKKRAWLLSTVEDEPIVMLDDDLRFAVRDGAGGRLVDASPEIVGAYLFALETSLQLYVHAGFSARQGNNHLPGGWVTNTRMMYVLGYQPHAVRKHCELGRIETREDMDITLQLLRKGFPNAVCADICVDQKYNAPGGASGQRTMAASDADAELLAALHPGFVKVVQRAYASSVPRKEVVVQWKKAFESSGV